MLDSLPTHVMSLFPIPANVVKQLNRLRRDILQKRNKEVGVQAGEMGGDIKKQRPGRVENQESEDPKLLLSNEMAMEIQRDKVSL